ncbi:unnamed protein product, partial [Polarella glacialis]
MGDGKSELLLGLLRPGDRVLEFGTFVGYSSLRLAQQLRRLGGGGQVVSCEVGADAACVARELHSFAGFDPTEVKVQIGSAADWLASGRLGEADVLVMDHRGTRYHEDLAALESSGSGAFGSRPGSRVFADNVLLPGAPLFLDYVSRSSECLPNNNYNHNHNNNHNNNNKNEGCRSLPQPRYQLAIHEVPEFLQPELDDWVVVCEPQGLKAVSTTAWPPADLLRLSAQIDAFSWQSERQSVDWAELQEIVSPMMQHLRKSAEAATATTTTATSSGEAAQQDPSGREAS